jgi:hypothetical protein
VPATSKWLKLKVGLSFVVLWFKIELQDQWWSRVHHHVRLTFGKLGQQRVSGKLQIVCDSRQTQARVRASCVACVLRRACDGWVETL